MNKGITYKGIILSVFICIFIVYMSIIFKPISREIHNYYQVYLGGEKIGLIESDTELYNLIDKEQQSIKDKYNVDKVHSPEGLEVNKVATYNNNTMSVKEVYDEIKDLDPFTIEGYEVTIKNKNDEKQQKIFYILNKEDLDVAVKRTVLAFVSEETYDKYLKGTQDEVTDTGKEITNIYLNDDVTIKKKLIPVDENIFTDADKLSMFFMFGTTNLSKKYTVKASDTIASIAYDNQLGVKDFLIANPDIVGENQLLAAGQEVTVDPVTPLSGIVVESFETEYQTIKYETKIEFDVNLNADQTYVKESGSDGLSKVTFATKEVNGLIRNSAQVSNEVITPAVDRVVVYGAKNVVYYGNTTYWAWPTVKPFRISSHYGYRIHPIRGTAHLHNGTDITGTASNNIFAIQSGEVTRAGWSGGGEGINVIIDHHNGYSSQYMHLAEALVDEGDEVEKGQLIGIMGCTGSCTGKHLHFTVRHDGSTIDPLSLYE